MRKVNWDAAIPIVEAALGYKLHEWQVQYLTNGRYYALGRATGKTTIYIVKLILTREEPITIKKRLDFRTLCDGDYGAAYYEFFANLFLDIWVKLREAGLQVVELTGRTFNEVAYLRDKLKSIQKQLDAKIVFINNGWEEERYKLQEEVIRMTEELQQTREELERTKQFLREEQQDLKDLHDDYMKQSRELEQVKAHRDELKKLYGDKCRDLGRVVDERYRMERELDQVKAERDPIVTFARKVIQAALNGGQYDGGEIQDLGVKLGLLEEVAYVPEKHGENVDFEPGDPYFVFTPILSQYKGEAPKA